MTRRVIQHGTMEVVEVRPVIEEQIRCDKCGCEISDELGDFDDNLYPQTVEVALNLDLCVRDGAFRRDYCKTCCNHVWAAICTIIQADPDDDSRSDYEDD